MRSFRFILVGMPMVGAVFVLAAPVPAHAQEEAVSREVVQALPSAEVRALNDALKRLSYNGRNLRALIDAGNAALALGDAEAAIGFFSRAEEVDPKNADVKMGLATIFMQSQRPLEALRYFAEAEAAGMSPDTVAADRGLAFDLVGKSEEAQAIYLRALSFGENPETRRRLALSFAISGRRDEFDATLRPLMMERDVAAFRARAFGLAILGDMNEARGIVTTVIPRDLASRIIPYLEFMPRLTKSQQAAAANLGIFPKAAEIGRDDPAIIAYRAKVAAEAAGGVPPPPQAEPKVQTVNGSGEQHWVQLAAGRNRDALRSDWDRIKRRVPNLLGPYEPQVVKLGRHHRLLAGPFADQKAALDLVTALARKRVDSLSVKSAPGTKVEPLQ